MIVDDLVNDIPKIKEFVDRGHIVRVPYRLIPEESKVGTYEWDETLKRLMPSEEIQLKGIWNEIKLPYEHLVLVSQMNDGAVIFIDSTIKEGEIYLNLKMFMYNGENLGSRIIVFRIDPDGKLYSMIDKNSSKEEYEEFIDYSLFCEQKLITALGLTDTNEHNVERLAEIYKTEDMREGFLRDLNWFGVLVTVTAILFSCKNIIREKVVPDAHIQKKRSKRGKLPLYSYHILKVKPVVLKKNGVTENNGESVAIHWVRGHFKHYTENKKLFGKYVGIYWWQSHIAGKANRFVDKEYELLT